MNNSIAQRLKEQQLARVAAAQDMKKRAQEKARYIEILAAKGIREAEEAKQRKLDEEEEKLRIMEENRLREIEEKTHKYYEYNQYNRKKAVDGLPMYFGETERVFEDNKKSAWRPHGAGEFHYDGSVQYEGTFKHGALYGKGKFMFSDDQASAYLGNFYRGNMHGTGVMTTTKSRANVLMRDNVVICAREDLREGKQFEFDDPALGIYVNESAACDHCFVHSPDITMAKKKKDKKALMNSLSSGTGELSAVPITQTSLLHTNGNNKVKATLLRHVYDWRYLFRFDAEVYPKQREIDLATVKYFKVLHHMPLVYHLDTYTNAIGGTGEGYSEPTFNSPDRQAARSAARLESREARSASNKRRGIKEGTTKFASDRAAKEQEEYASEAARKEALMSRSSLRHNINDLTASWDVANYNTNRNYNSNSKTDPGVSYDYFADTFGVVSKPNLTESMHFTTLTNATINNRDNAKSRGSVRLDQNSVTLNDQSLRDAKYGATVASNPNFSGSVTSLGDTLNFSGTAISTGDDKDRSGSFSNFGSSFGFSGFMEANASDVYYNGKCDNTMGPDQFDNYRKSRQLQAMDGANRRSLARQIIGTKPLTIKQRYVSDHSENMFESFAIGIGAAEEEEKERLRQELKKQQWAELIQEKKRRMEEERQRQIAEQQAAMMNESIKEQQKATQEKKAAEEAYAAEVKRKMDEEASKWDKGIGTRASSGSAEEDSEED